MRLQLVVLMLVAAVATTGVRGVIPARAGAPGTGLATPVTGRVSAAVYGALAQSGRVRVNITLAAAQPAPRSRAEARRRAAAAQAEVLARVTPADVSVVHQYSALPALAASVSAAGVAQLDADPGVVSVTLDGTGMGAAGIAPPVLAASPRPLAHSVPMIRADLVHAAGITGSGVTVAILDSGADTDHPDLADSIAGQECFLTGAGSKCPDGTTRQSGPGAAEDDLGHGSNVAGIVTSNGVVSSVGVAPGANVLLYKILNSSNFGVLSDWDAALDDIIAHHPEVRVINMSLVTFTTYVTACGSVDPVEALAFQTLTDSGVSIFVSSGNNGAKSAITFPACLPDAVAVGAVYDQSFGSSTFFGCTDAPATIDVPTCWSNSSPQLALLAPGTYIVSDGLGGGTSTYIGTSQASPHAAGVAALMLEHAPALTPAQILSTLRDTGVPRADPANALTRPRIDAMAAVFPPPPALPVGGIAMVPDVDPRAGTQGAGVPLFALIAAGLVLGSGALWLRSRRRSGA